MSFVLQNGYIGETTKGSVTVSKSFDFQYRWLL